MAILKHTSSKNSAYGDALDYLKYRHREDSKTGLYEPILDEYGLKARIQELKEARKALEKGQRVRERER